MWGLVIKHLHNSQGTASQTLPPWPFSWGNLAEEQKTAGMSFSFGSSSETLGWVIWISGWPFAYCTPLHNGSLVPISEIRKRWISPSEFYTTSHDKHTQLCLVVALAIVMPTVCVGTDGHSFVITISQTV